MDVRTPVLFLAAVLAILTAGVSPAGASTTLRTDPGGALLSGSTTVRSGAGGSFTAASQLGAGTCTEAGIDFDVQRNSSATSITGSLTSLTFTSCTGQFTGTTFASCTLSADDPFPTVHITAGVGGGTVTITDLTVRCSFMSSPSFCYFTATTVVGTFQNGPATLRSTNVAFTPTTGTTGLPFLGCGGTGTVWSWDLTDLVQSTTNRTLTVTTS